jgi:hypothetical protein
LAHAQAAATLLTLASALAFSMQPPPPLHFSLTPFLSLLSLPASWSSTRSPPGAAAPRCQKPTRPGQPPSTSVRHKPLHRATPPGDARRQRPDARDHPAPAHPAKRPGHRPGRATRARLRPTPCSTVTRAAEVRCPAQAPDATRQDATPLPIRPEPETAASSSPVSPSLSLH